MAVLYDGTVDGELTCRLALKQWGDPARPGILLWPGLGSTAAYFASVVAALPGRAVAVDPPGFGASPALDPCTYDQLVDLARAAADEQGCTAMVGHSLGAYVALGVGCDPPAALQALVLIDGGFMTPSDLAELGMPVLSGRAELVAFMEANQLRFPDWVSASRQIAELLCAEASPAVEAYIREALVEVDGEVREPPVAQQAADLLLAVAEEDVVSLGPSLKVPTLLIACGQPSSHRPLREKAWQTFVGASPLVELHVADEWGHNPVLQAPEALSALIANWLTAHI